MIDLNKLTSAVNARYGTRSSATSARMIKAAQKCEAFDLTAEDVLDYLKDNPPGSKWDLADTLVHNGYNISEHRATKIAEEAQKRGNSDKKIDEEAKSDTLDITQAYGVMERALIGMMNPYFDSVIPTITQRIYDELSSKGVTPIKKFVLEGQDTGVEGPVDPNFELICTLVQGEAKGGPCPYLVGPAGSGKSSIAAQVAKVLNVPFYSSNAVLEPYKLSGFIDAGGTFQETDFYKAWTQGGVFCLDEVDGSAPEALIDLNGALASRMYPFPTGLAEAHPDFRFIATANTFGTGASMDYVGRNQLDAATLDRFFMIHVDYNPEIEQNIADKIGDTDLIPFVQAFRKAVANAEMHIITSYRFLKTVELYHGTLTPKQLVQGSLVKGVEPDDLKVLVRGLPQDNAYTKAVQELANERQ